MFSFPHSFSNTSDWGNNTPEGKRYRRYVTNKWGWISFWLTLVLMVLVISANTILGPALVTLVNERPTRLYKWLLARSWMKITMWALAMGLMVAAVAQTDGLDLIYLAKRLGRQAVALMPAMYLLTMRPSPLPQAFYLQLVSIHKFLSRVVVLFSMSHGIFYVVIYYRDGQMWKLCKTANLLGIGALLMFTAMAISGIVFARRRMYELFYQLHVIGAWMTLPMSQKHSRPRSNLYSGMCAFLLSYQVAARIYLSHLTKLRVQYVSPTLLLVTIPKSFVGHARQFWFWPVASHLRLSGSIVNPLNWIRSSHPYTIASLPEDGDIKLVIRPGDFKIKMRKTYTIFGPHRSIPDYLSHQIHNLMVRRTSLVVGGAGVAFGAPMMRYLRLYGVDVRMVWVMRDPYDARVLPQLGSHEEVLGGNIEIYYTGESIVNQDNNGIENEDQTLTIGVSDSACDEDYGMGTIQSATRHPGVASRRVRGDKILSEYAMFMANSRPHSNSRLKSWLYGYSTSTFDCCCADRVIESCAEDRLGSWVMACGNSQLNHTAEEWAKNAGVCYFQDTFSL